MTVNKFDDDGGGLAEVAKDCNNKHESSFQSFERVLLSTPDTVVKCDGEMMDAPESGSPNSEREAVYLFKDQDEQIFTEPAPVLAISPKQRSVEEQDAA